MKNFTRQLGYVPNPTHEFKLNLTSFPPSVNPNYLELWSEFIHLDSVIELYGRSKDPKVSISQVALAFINYLRAKRLPNIFNKVSIDPTKISYEETLSQISTRISVLKNWLDSKQFTRYFLISNRKLKVYYSDNRLLHLKIPHMFEFNIELVTKQPIDKVWSVFPTGYWPDKPSKMNVNFPTFCERSAGLSEFGDFKAALLTGDLLAIRIQIPVSEILLGRVQNSTVERKLQLAIKGKL